MSKTVRVRIAVVVDPSGYWNSCGWGTGGDSEKMALAVETMEEGESRFWLEADLPVPEVPVIDAEVVKDE